MNKIILLAGHSTFTVADGNSWSVSAVDEISARVVEVLSNTMQLDKLTSLNGQQNIVVKNGFSSNAKSLAASLSSELYSVSGENHPLVYQIDKPGNTDELALLLMKLSLVFCSHVEARGGVLIHGALVEKDGEGIILAGPGDVGKTTASNRIPPPWKSLCDDCTLVVRDRDGLYRAHPWPTWSTYMFGGTGGSWDVQYSIPLKAIFILQQSPTDQAEPLGQGETVCLLNETAEQAWLALENELDQKIKHDMSLQRFNNICELTKKIPAYLLHISKTGVFWEEMSKVLSKS